MNLHSLLSSLEGNSDTGPGESSSFFSPLIISPQEGSPGAGTGLHEVMGEPEQGKVPGKSEALVTLESLAVSQSCRGWSDVGFTPVQTRSGNQFGCGLSRNIATKKRHIYLWVQHPLKGHSSSLQSSCRSTHTGVFLFQKKTRQGINTGKSHEE